MLSAYRPQVVLELKKQDKARVEVILAHRDRLLVGLSTGCLRIYRNCAPGRVDQEESAEGSASDYHSHPGKKRVSAAELLREIETFARKAPQQLAIVEAAEVLISLVDGYVSLHETRTYSLNKRLDRSKGAVTFALLSSEVTDADNESSLTTARLAVAVKRKILVWSWQGTKFTDEPFELTLAAPLKSLHWMSATSLIAGLDLGFVLVNIEDQTIKDVNRPSTAGEATNTTGSRFGAVNSSSMGYMGMGSWVPKPLATKLGTEEMLLAKDVNTLFIDSVGEPLEKRQIPWAAAPEAVSYLHPYILALQVPTKGALDIRNPDSLSLLQTVSVPRANIMHVSQQQASVARELFVANDRCIWRMKAIPYSHQINELIANRRYNEATSLIGLLDESTLPDKHDRLREIQILIAEDMFSIQKYRDAMGFFIKASAPPQRVLLKYPEKIAGRLAPQEVALSTQDELRESDLSTGDTEDVQEQDQAPDSDNLRSKDGGDISSALADGEAASMLSTDSELPATTPGANAGVGLDGEELLTATKALFGFLAHTRKQIQRFINFDGTLKDTAKTTSTHGAPDYAYLLVMQNKATDKIDWPHRLLETAILVDTTLFRAYMYALPRLAGSLFRIDNFCAPEVVEEKLYANGNYADLIDFLHGKKLHRQALELLEKLGRSGPESAVEAHLRGPQRLVAYLQQLPPEELDLVLHFAKWPIETDPEVGMQIFLADTSNAESLSRSKVLRFLEDQDAGLATKYLEHVIEEYSDTTADFHERLVGLYLSQMTDGRTSHAEKIQVKLEKFLRGEHQLNNAKVLSKLPSKDSAFFESRAILHQKLSQHLQALKIYAFEINDAAKAETYCNAVYLANTGASSTLLDENESVYTTLLSLFLNPDSPHMRNLDAALDLLSRHGSRIPALSTLEFLPPDLSVEKLEAYFRGRMRAANSVAREEAIARALAGAVKSSIDIKLQVGDGDDDHPIQASNDGSQVSRGQNRRVVLSEDRMCSGCHKRFGRAAVRVWPSGEIRHYGCGEPQIWSSNKAGTSMAVSKGARRSWQYR